MALIFVLVAVTSLGLMAGIAGSSWQTIIQRANEEELLWRGGQIRKAIGHYYKTAQAGSGSTFPRNLEQLLKDPRFVGTKRHLRRLYLDPMTDDEWVLIKEPNGRIKGVRSSSKKEPFKKDGFSVENQDFAGKAQYFDWQFIYEPKKAEQQSTTGTTQQGTLPQGTTPAPTPTQ